MSNGYEWDEGLALEDYSEYDEGESDYDVVEARRRPPIRRATARGGSYRAPASARAQSEFVRRRDLQEALQPISADMRRNAQAIQTVGRQLDALNSRTRAARREFQSLQSNLGLTAILPLLTSPKPIEITLAGQNVGGTPVEQGTKIARASDGLGALLPLLLSGSGGLGGTGTGTGQAGAMQDQSMLLVLALALSNQSK